MGLSLVTCSLTVSSRRSVRFIRRMMADGSHDSESGGCKVGVVAVVLRVVEFELESGEFTKGLGVVMLQRARKAWIITEYMGPIKNVDDIKSSGESVSHVCS